MPSAPSHSLALTELVAALGHGLANLACGAELAVSVDDVTLAEPQASVIGAPGDVVLGVGIHESAAALELIESAAARGVAAVALRNAVATDPAVTAAANARGIPVVAIADAASWAHVAWLAREVLDRALTGGSRPDAGSDELVRLADACADLLGAPVTIEDTHSRVVAYSEQGGLADPVRVSTIVGRRVPAATVTALRSRGVFRHLVRSPEPLFLAASKELGARLIVPVRFADEWIGSIWAMVDEPVPDALVAPLREVAAIVALHLLRLRSASELTRRLLADQVLAALAGDAPAAHTSLVPAPWRVVVLGTDPTTTEPAERLAVWESMMRRASWHRPSLVAVDDELIAVVADRPDNAEPGTWRWLARLTRQVQDSQRWAYAAAGPIAVSAAELPKSLEVAREVAGLKRETAAGGAASSAVLTPDDVWAPLVVSQALRSLPRPEGPSPQGTRVGPDEWLDPTLAETLRAWLDHPGDLRACAAELHVHANTVRYRLGRIRSQLGVDLADPTVRLALALQLRA